MSTPRKQAKQVIPPWAIALTVAVVLLGVGLYGYNVGWFGGDDGDDAFPAPQLGQAPPERKIATHDDAVARASWGAPVGTPTAGVGDKVAADAPSMVTLTPDNGRANVAIRLPRARSNGTSYTGFSLELRSDGRRLWGSYLPAQQAHGDEPILLSLNAELLRSIQADQNLSVLVGGTAPRKGDTLGIVNLTLQ